MRKSILLSEDIHRYLPQGSDPFATCLAVIGALFRIEIGLYAGHQLPRSASPPSPAAAAADVMRRMHWKSIDRLPRSLRAYSSDRRHQTRQFVQLTEKRWLNEASGLR